MGVRDNWSSPALPDRIKTQTLSPVVATRICCFAALAERYVEGVSREEYYPSPSMAYRWCSFRRQCKGWKGERRKALR